MGSVPIWHWFFSFHPPTVLLSDRGCQITACTRGGGAPIERVRYDDLVATRRLYPGQAARVCVIDADESGQPAMRNGEIVAPRSSEIALRLWQRIPGVEPGQLTTLRIEVEHHSALYFANAGPVEPPYPGETFWAPAPLEWSRVDRRRAYRLEVDLPVRVFVPGSPVPALRRLLDLSASGCRVEPLAVDIGAEVEVRFGLLPTAMEVIVRARVVRTGGTPSSSWTALAFVGLDSAGEERITRFLLDQQRRELASRLSREGTAP